MEKVQEHDLYLNQNTHNFNLKTNYWMNYKKILKVPIYLRSEFCSFN